MQVAVLDLDGDRAQAEAASIADEHDVETLGTQADVADAASVGAAAAAVQARFGRADLVVSNVGVQLFGPVERFTDSEWAWVLDVNVIGSARVARTFIPLLRESRGRLAFTTSSSVLDPASRLAAYQASKFAVWGLAETLRLELANDGIGVTVLFPSGMLSRHLERGEAAQPAHVRRPIAGNDDFAAMVESNPDTAAALATPEEAARPVFAAILAGEPYVITHGDLTGAIDARAAALRRAADAAASSTPLVLVEHPLDLRAGDVLATRDDHVMEPVAAGEAEFFHARSACGWRGGRGRRASRGPTPSSASSDS